MENQRVDDERLNKQLQGHRVNEGKTISVLLVDDQPSVRRGLRMRLELEPDMSVVGEAGDGEEATSLAQALRPDVVIMDVRMPGTDGVSATETLRAIVSQSAIVILSLYDDAETRARAEAAGATAFVAKHQMGAKLLATIRRVVSSTESGEP
jgi:DNA-binding NarL/FixJ family response regulator